MDSNKILSYIEQMKNSELPDFSNDIQKSKGITKFIKRVTLKLTWWIVRPMVTYINNYKETNYEMLMTFYHYTKHLEMHLENTNKSYGEALRTHGEALGAHGEVLREYEKRLETQKNEIATHDNTINELNKQIIKSQENYEQWIALNEPTEFELKCQRGQRFEYTPIIDLIFKAEELQPNRLRDLIYSLKVQTYSRWNLFILTSSDVLVEKVEELRASDDRIKCNHIETTINDNNITNFAIRETTGDYIGFISADDIFAPFALYEVAKKINEYLDAELLYGNEDKITDGGRCEPVYKPGFAPDTLRSTNYIGNFFIIKKSTLAQVVKHMEYTADTFYEMLLRTVEITSSAYHISMILNHKSISKAHDIDKYAITKGANSELIKSHISRKYGLKAAVRYIGIEDIYRVDYEVIGSPKISILIPNKDYVQFLKTCIDSIQELTTYKNYEIVIIENNSSNQETFEYYNELEKTDKIRVLHYPEKGFNYQKIINFGVKNCETDYILQLNNDMELITPNWLELMLGYAQRNDVGAIGVKLYYPDMSIQHAGGVFTNDEHVCDHIFRYMPRNAHGYGNRDVLTQNMSWVTGACLMCSKELYEDIGYMNEDFEISYGDVDFCMKIIENGKSIIFNPFVELIHYEGKTRGACETMEELLVFIRERQMLTDKWYKQIGQGDSYYTPGADKVFFSNNERE
ncbi:MAG: glycosyltransferase [Oscillospiraceae bacterium]|nr:glycosyltransferase [Oscillospiraceae bacterium]